MDEVVMLTDADDIDIMNGLKSGDIGVVVKEEDGVVFCKFHGDYYSMIASQLLVVGERRTYELTGSTA